MFKDRYDAGYQLAAQLQDYKNAHDLVILAIPRGSLEIGYVLAKELHAPLDVIFTKKIGSPGDPEMAIGTVSMDQVMIAPPYDEMPHLAPYINEQVTKIRATLAERIKKYRGNKPPLDLKNKIVILVDDGVATGQTLSLAIRLVKLHKPKKLIVALPVGPADTLNKMRKEVDELVCLLVPGLLFSIGQFYESFPQVEDDQAIKLLKEANA